MAENVADHLAYWLKLNVKFKEYLGQIRHWDNLKVAQDEESIWVKDFTQTQLESLELQTIPFAELWYSSNNLLFPKGGLVPSGKLPFFLWTPIARALPVKLTGFNHNFFGVQQQLPIKLSPANDEQKPTILLTDIDTAGNYIETAPAARLEPLQWIIVNECYAFIIGTPLLPLNGKAYWKKDEFIFPAGYAFEFSILEKTVAKKMDPTGENLIWWVDELKYSLIPKSALQALTIASWRQTLNAFGKTVSLISDFKNNQ